MNDRGRKGAGTRPITHFLEILLLCGVPLSLATQFRPISIGGQALGPGELLLFAWAALAWLRRPGTGFRFDGKLPRYWALAFAGLLIGSANAFLNDVVPPDGTRTHDSVAYLFCAVLSVAFLTASPATQRARQDFALKFGFALAAPLCFLWIAALNTTTVGSLHLWYYYRFIGWAVNPNQTALALIPVPFLMFHALDGRIRPQNCSQIHFFSVVVAAAAAAVLSISAVWATSSNAGRLALVVGLGLLLAITLSQWYAHREERYAKMAKAVLLVIALAFAINVTVGPEVRSMQPERKTESQTIGDAIREPFINKDEGSREVWGRLALLENGLLAALESHLLGFGPGCFSGLDGPRMGSEAHNTPVDWLTCAGLVGLVAMTTLLIDLARSLWRRRAYSLFAGLAAFAAFAQFHYVLRHPLTWVFLAFVEVVAGSSPAAADTRTVRRRAARVYRGS